MIISEKIHKTILNYGLLLIASVLIFRQISTIIIFVFVFYCFLNYKKFAFDDRLYLNQFFCATPLLINVLFFWNNSNAMDTLKDVEKYICLLFFPICIVGNSRFIDVTNLLRRYSILFGFILSFLFLRYVLLFPELFAKYQNGIHQWEMGYSFAKTFGTQAPALNMHIAFATAIAFYFFLKDLKQKSFFTKTLFNFLVVTFLFYFLLYVNTRLALANVIIGILIIIGTEVLSKSISNKSIFISITTFVLMIAGLSFFVLKNPYMIEKYSTVTFANIDKIGRLDEIDNVQAVACNAFVTRLSIWKSASELILERPYFGYGSAQAKQKLFDYFRKTNQMFLYRNCFPVHNQFLDFLLKFGIAGGLVVLIYLFNILLIGIHTKNVLAIVFFIIFFNSNLLDDFLIRFDGIVYSGFWISCFLCIPKNKYLHNEDA